MKSENQEGKELKRLSITVRTFLYNYEGNVSDHDLAIALNSMGVNTSSATVCRDLNNPKIARLFGKHVYEVIQDLRNKNNKHSKKYNHKHNHNR